MAKTFAAARRMLIITSRMRVTEAWFTSVAVILLGYLASRDLSAFAIALGITVAFVFVLDSRIRFSSSNLLGPDASPDQAPVVIRKAINEASAPLGISRRKLFPRHVRDKGDSFHTAFAAAALNTTRGAIIFMGDALVQRSKEAVDPKLSPGERRFAYDEVRAVLGHELAHILPGTGVSSRLLALPYRFSTDFPSMLFWTAAVLHNAAHAGIAWLVVRVLTFVSNKAKIDKREFATLAKVPAIVITVIDGGGYWVLALYLFWMQLRPLPAMFLQRRIETACDEVAVAGGADPSALARFLQRFEPEHLKYLQMPLWRSLHATHPKLHKRIVDLDSRPISRARR